MAAEMTRDLLISKGRIVLDLEKVKGIITLQRTKYYFSLSWIQNQKSSAVMEFGRHTLEMAKERRKRKDYGIWKAEIENGGGKEKKKRLGYFGNYT